MSKTGLSVTEYPTLRNALSIFSIQTGLDADAARQALRQSLDRAEYRAALQRELANVLSDASVSWKALVANESYEVDEASDEADARAIVLALLWPEVFPDRSRPENG